LAPAQEIAIGSSTATPPLPPLKDQSVLQRVQSGEAAAQFEVGLAYAEGRRITQDWNQAAAWLQKAADRNYAPADRIR